MSAPVTIPEAQPGVRLGLLGGTFDPPHLGHLGLARAARDRVPLDRVLFVPSRAPYHKDAPGATFDQRAAMTAAMLEDEPGMEVSVAEREGEGNSYTVDLLARFAAAGWGPDQLYFLMGADSLEDLPGWRQYQRLLALATVVAVARPGHHLSTDPLGPAAEGRVVLVEDYVRKVSSSALRAAIAEGDEAAVAGQLHPAVRAQAARLYRR